MPSLRTLLRHDVIVTVTLLCVLLVLPLAVRAADGDTGDQEEFQARDCQDHRANGQRGDKVYVIYPANKKKTVFCEGMSENATEDTAWTVIQRRRDGGIDFNNYWRHYKRGFGPRETDHWIGNEAIYDITNAGPKYILRIELETWDTPSTHKHADYSEFSIGTEDEKYPLKYANYSGDAGDSLRFHKGMKFSTPDRDNDEWPQNNCAEMLDSGWWFADCGSANLNGQFYRGQFNADRDSPYRGGIWWFGMGGLHYSFRSVMKIRPVMEDYVPPGIIAKRETSMNNL